jgi:hypothetical protein
MKHLAVFSWTLEQVESCSVNEAHTPRKPFCFHYSGNFCSSVRVRPPQVHVSKGQDSCYDPARTLYDNSPSYSKISTESTYTGAVSVRTGTLKSEGELMANSDLRTVAAVLEYIVVLDQVIQGIETFLGNTYRLTKFVVAFIEKMLNVKRAYLAGK